jgi:hypothetical protein
LFDSLGGRCLAQILGIPHRDREAFETGEQMHAETMLGFIEVTGASAQLLLSRSGNKDVSETQRSERFGGAK